MKILKIVDVPLNEECLNRGCRNCKDSSSIVESFVLIQDEQGVKHATNDFMCKNCRDVIQPNAKNGYKTFEHGTNLKKSLLNFVEVRILRDVLKEEVFHQGVKFMSSFKKDGIVFVPAEQNVLSQYKLNLDGFVNDNENTTVFIFSQEYEPVPILFPKNALDADSTSKYLSRRMF